MDPLLEGVSDESNFSSSPLPSSPSTWPSTSWLCFIAISVLGIIFNISIFWKRKYTRNRGTSSTRLSLSLLCVMAGADTACLVALLFILSLRYLGVQNHLFLTVACKLSVFTIHSASAFSLYCWLVLSLVRYVAVYSPYTHLTIHREPLMAVVILAVLSGVLESWLLYDVEYIPELGGCESTREGTSQKRLQIAEIIGSYFIPLFIITACDIKVLCFRSGVLESGWRCSGKEERLEDNSPDRMSITSQEHEKATFVPPRSTAPVKDERNSFKGIRSKKRLIQMRALRRALLISVFDLLMNLPNYLFRLYLTIMDYDVSSINPELLHFAENISQIMYFAQFSLNAFYLVCLIYDSPRPSNKKQLLVTQQSLAYQGITNGRSSFKLREPALLKQKSIPS